MFDRFEIRAYPAGKILARFGAYHQGQGHETTYAQIIAHALEVSVEDALVEEGDTDTALYGLGTYASRSTPMAEAAAMCARRHP
ncbi:MAG: molybdopterin-dependent oxidoreductase [Thermoflexus sp.]|jgi:carbon-monoxide dehydrogenase large subunit|nr:molybdopterin-dependent oxidoreductase [Thermoflexus sp.]